MNKIDILDLINNKNGTLKTVKQYTNEQNELITIYEKNNVQFAVKLK